MTKMNVAAFVVGILGLILLLLCTLFGWLPSSTTAFGAMVLDVSLALSAGAFAMGLTGLLSIENKFIKASGALGLVSLILIWGPARSERTIASAFLLKNGGRMNTSCAGLADAGDAITKVLVIDGDGEKVHEVVLNPALAPAADAALVWYEVPSAGAYYVRVTFANGDVGEACAQPLDRKLETSVGARTLTFHHVK